MVRQVQRKYWIVSKSKADLVGYLREQKVRSNDIYVVYDSQLQRLIQAGRLRSSGGLPAVYSIPKVSLAFFDDGYGKYLQDVLSNGDAVELYSGGWNSLREHILAQDQAFQRWIDEHDNEIPTEALITGPEAVLADLFMFAIEMFSPSNSAELNRLYKEWKKSRIQENLHRLSDIGKAETYQKPYLNNLFSSLQNKEIEAKYIENPRPDEIQARLQPPIHETDAINTDLRIELPGTQLQNQEAHIISLRDRDDGRELTVCLGHQKGYNQTDWVGADLIYVCEVNRSFVFVQYKRQSDTGSVSLTDKSSRDQLDIMLETCQLQDPCRNRDEGTQDLRRSVDMRLQDCPVFYKIIESIPALDETTRFIKGQLVPTCLLCKLQTERTGALKTKDINRGLSVHTFAELLRKAQIGSRASAYEMLRGRMNAHLTQSMTAIAVERIR